MKNARVLKWWSKRNLPDDLWPDILSRLPVKSLLRFRCVCRSWKSCIDDPDFTRLHFTHFNSCSQSQYLFVLSQRGQCVVKNSETLRTTSTLGFLLSDVESPDVLKSTWTGVNGVWWSICSSIDGLFLLDCGTNLMLWNPSIKKTLPLPLPEIPLLDAEHENSDSVAFGLGFDPLTRDYNVVKFVLLPKKGVQFAAVYTLGTNSWKLIECWIEGRKDLAFHSWRSSISFNGVLYGLARDYQTICLKLVSFDLRTEVFASFELPVTDRSNFHSLSIIDDGCSLALIHLYKSNLSVWALEGLGNDSNAWSWIQRCNFVMVSPGQLYDYEFLCIKKNGEMLLKWRNMVVCYNLETRERKIFMEKNKLSFDAYSMFNYKESLIMHS